MTKHITTNHTISWALRHLADTIQAPDDVPAAAMREAAMRVDELHDVIVEWLPVMRAHAEANHMMDGFNRRENKYDKMLERAEFLTTAQNQK